MEKLVKAGLSTVIFTVVVLVVLGFMAITRTGVAIINDGERGVMKTGTQYEMTEIKPGYHFFIPVYQSIDIDTIRPKLINYSRTEGNRPDGDLLIFEPVLQGLDKKGIPIKLALSIEVKPVSDQLAEMYKNDGDFENAFYKKVLQVNRDAVQSTISRFNVDTIMDNRAEVEKTLTDKLTKSYAQNPYFKLVNINLKDIIVPTKIQEAQLQVQIAKQSALKSLELIKKAENEAKAVVMKADGEANAIKIKADSEAYANKAVSKSITEKLLKLESIKKWNGVTPSTVGNEKSSFIFSIK